MIDAMLDEELTDILEVLYVAANAKGYSMEEVETCRLRKKKERGGFEKKILLKEVRE